MQKYTANCGDNNYASKCSSLPQPKKAQWQIPQDLTYNQKQKKKQPLMLSIRENLPCESKDGFCWELYFLHVLLYLESILLRAVAFSSWDKNKHKNRGQLMLLYSIPKLIEMVMLNFCFIRNRSRWKKLKKTLLFLKPATCFS